jgi:pheromone shutdown protein TraB
MTAEDFCNQEGEHVESPAIAACYNLKLDPRVAINPIDYPSARTRRRLAFSLILHPIESIILISRFHGQPMSSEMDSLDNIVSWRHQFELSCPTAYKILFTEREDHMVTEISEIASIERPESRIAVIVGVSHVDAVYEKLVSLVQ